MLYNFGFFQLIKVKGGTPTGTARAESPAGKRPPVTEISGFVSTHLIYKIGEIKFAIDSFMRMASERSL